MCPNAHVLPPDRPGPVPTGPYGGSSGQPNRKVTSLVPRTELSLLGQPHDPCPPDMLVSVRLAGEHDDLALATGDGQDGSHGLESLRV